MKRYLVLSCTFVLLFGLAGVAGADPTVTFGGTLTDPGGLNQQFTSSEPGALVETFDGSPNPFVQPWLWSGSYDIVSGSQEGAYAAPSSGPPVLADPSQYMVVPKVPNVSGEVEVAFGSTQNYFGIWWGSIDTYNEITFYLAGTQVFKYDGSLIPPANGSWTGADSNQYVNFTGFVFDTVELESSNIAFEFDNVAARAVPIPGAVWLLGSGLLGLLGFRRKVLG